MVNCIFMRSPVVEDSQPTTEVSYLSHTHFALELLYHMQSQDKSVIEFVQQYKNVYAMFEAYLRRNEGLIAKSLLFKYLTFPIV